MVKRLRKCVECRGEHIEPIYMGLHGLLQGQLYLLTPLKKKHVLNRSRTYDVIPKVFLIEYGKHATVVTRHVSIVPICLAETVCTPSDLQSKFIMLILTKCRPPRESANHRLETQINIRENSEALRGKFIRRLHGPGFNPVTGRLCFLKKISGHYSPFHAIFEISCVEATSLLSGCLMLIAAKKCPVISQTVRPTIRDLSTISIRRCHVNPLTADILK
jgi:hypothetical protein